MKFAVASCLLLLLAGYAYAESDSNKHHQDQEQATEMKDHDHSKMTHRGEEALPEDSGKHPRVGVDEKLGEFVPIDLQFVDENKQTVKLANLIDRPTILLLIFYTCPQSCSIMLANVAGVMRDIKDKIGEDYNSLVISFDDEESSELAVSRKKNYTPILPAEFPAEKWQFLTGSKEAIKKLTQSLGYRYQKTGKHSFIHPNVLMVLAPDGKIIRYLYGPNFLPFDVSMALTEAAKGTPSASIRKLLSFCFEYDPDQRGYVVNFMRIGGIVVLLIVAFLFFFVIRGRKN